MPESTWQGFDIVAVGFFVPLLRVGLTILLSEFNAHFDTSHVFQYLLNTHVCVLFFMVLLICFRVSILRIQHNSKHLVLFEKEELLIFSVLINMYYIFSVLLIWKWILSSRYDIIVTGAERLFSNPQSRPKWFLIRVPIFWRCGYHCFFLVVPVF